MKCVKRSRTLVIMYMDDKGKVTKRTIRVLKINSTTFTAYCCLRNARRTFKTSNLLAVVPKLEREVV